MVIRSLCGALILLILSAPLNALLCASCAPEHCMLAGMEAPSELSEPEAEGHCQQAEEASEMSMAGPDVSSVMASSDCCKITRAPQAETSATPAVSTSFDFFLEVSASIEAPIAGLHRIERPHNQLPRLVHQPLYTLHSAFLI